MGIEVRNFFEYLTVFQDLKRICRVFENNCMDLRVFLSNCIGQINLKGFKSSKNIYKVFESIDKNLYGFHNFINIYMAPNNSNVHTKTFVGFYSNNNRLCRVL